MLGSPSTSTAMKSIYQVNDCLCDLIPLENVVLGRSFQSSVLSYRKFPLSVSLPPFGTYGVDSGHLFVGQTRFIQARV